jgi:zinc/manganese transport system permease protein
LADKIPHGSEHLKHVLAGNILWVGWAEILKTTVIYGTLGVLHFLMRKKLMLISQDPEKARRQGIKVKLWDLVFYLSFGIVITSSVQIGGVLLVFSFLIVPALSAMLFYDGLRARVFLGWVLGGTVSLAGITASYFYDLPTGPAIVATFGAALGICFAIKRIFNLRAPT